MLLKFSDAVFNLKLLRANGKNSYRVVGIPELPDIAQIFSQVHGVWEVSAVVKLF